MTDRHATHVPAPIFLLFFRALVCLSPRPEPYACHVRYTWSIVIACSGFIFFVRVGPHAPMEGRSAVCGLSYSRCVACMASSKGHAGATFTVMCLEKRPPGKIYWRAGRRLLMCTGRISQGMPTRVLFFETVRCTNLAKTMEPQQHPPISSSSLLPWTPPPPQNWKPTRNDNKACNGKGRTTPSPRTCGRPACACGCSVSARRPSTTRTLPTSSWRSAGSPCCSLPP